MSSSEELPNPLFSINWKIPKDDGEQIVEIVSDA